MIKPLRLVAFIIFFAAPLFAQDISGDWQGTLNPGKSQLRMIMQISKTGDAQWKGTAFFIDRGPSSILVP